MQISIGILDIAVIILLLVISAITGVYFHFTGGGQKTIDEFLMGEKKMKIFPVSFSLMATVMSAIAILGIPAETYMYGTQGIMFVVGLLIGGTLCAVGFLPVYFELNVSTSYEYLEKRFGRTTRTIVSVLFIVQKIFYIAVVLYAPSIALNAITGMSMWVAVISMAAVSTFYCTLGGIKAVLWTDVFQSALMYVTLIAVIAAGSSAVGFTKVFTAASEGGRLIFFNMSTDLTERYTFWSALASAIVSSSAMLCGNQSEIQRILSVGKIKKGQMSVFYGVMLMFLFEIFCFWCGIVIYAVYRNCDPMLDTKSHLNSPDQMIPYTILKFFKDIPGLSGLCIAGIFSGSLSTISSAVNSMTSVTVEDFLKSFCHHNCLTESLIVGIAKSIVIVYGCLCLLLTYTIANFRGVMEATTIMNGMIAGPVLGVFLLGMFNKTANQQGILVGLAAGIALGSWIGVGSYIAKVPIPSLPRNTMGCPTMLNETANWNPIYNETLWKDFEADNNTSKLDQLDEKETFPLYKLTFQWVSVFGCVTSIVIGSVFSLLISLFKDIPPVHQQNISPIVRKLYYKNSDKNSDKILNPANSQLKLTTDILKLNVKEKKGEDNDGMDLSVR